MALVSGGEEDEHVITRAAGAALDHGAALRVVHAVALPATGPVLDSDHRFVLDNALRLLDELDRRPPHSGVLLRVHPHEAVTHYADHDLVVVGDGVLAEAGDRSGAVTRAALHHAPSPVLVVHGRGPVHERPASTLPSARTSAEAAHALF
ncbi:universal stress protein [Umezawaea endophytica]|uniref:universal stress protein n=1 Tax=Umezawaea endophytica TaxID=1654476 RepID=UPI0035E9CBE4